MSLCAKRRRAARAGPRLARDERTAAGTAAVVLGRRAFGRAAVGIPIGSNRGKRMDAARHIVPNPGREWELPTPGGRQPASHRPTPRDAVNRARAGLIGENGEFVIHDYDGALQPKVRFRPRAPRPVAA